ncbi:aldo/keto reductase [Oscillatoria acuminata]|uniref:Putative oxidoreductase, aryl-alcohol dehydrogenase like protein n=1 Tax=Oscillatoria acuminata PCC 6304 TaxID=56110 RepID=K9TIF8_9CYAN|nr:aldo/keto reductase [Oscillatoria acuminata]AFY81789.1 putative oxidoreductase, aryl-alcohol dehydrogenase like protein [Oscillatoria acuminata PCC 6304]
MEFIQLGSNGPTVPTLGIGAWSWGDTLFWNYGKDYGATQVQEAFHAAVEAGITFFDTAEVYGLGKSEQLLGQFIRQTETPIQVATKYGPLPWRFTAESVAEAITASLDRLQLTQVTLYQVHWPFTFLMSQETLMNALADEVEKGRIQTIGVSNYSAAQMREAHGVLSKRGIPLAVNQVRYSLLSREVESQGIIKTARELGITILAYSPLQQGLLTGKYTPESPQPSGPRQWDSRFKPEGLRKIAPVLDLLQQFGQNYGKTPAQVALNWLIAQGGIIPIPGAKNAEQARQNAGAVGWQLTADEVAQLEQVTRPWL